MERYIGSRFNELTVIRKKSNTYSIYYCICSCGKYGFFNIDNIKNGHTKSCGCFKIKTAGKQSVKHSMSKTRIYGIWKSIISRCYNKNSQAYKNYGGRGIAVCNRWHKFENFYKDMGDKPNGKSINRINNSRGYSIRNCEWSTYRKQARNKRNNRIIDIDGDKKPLAEWCEIFNLHYKNTHKKLQRNKPVKEIFKYK